MNEHSFIFAFDLRTRDENKEATIREKAMELIVKNGFDGMSMQKLAKEANVSPGTLYIYFKSREDMLNKVFIDVHQKFSAVALDGFSADLSFEEGLWLQWKNRLNFILNFPVHYNFLEQFKNSPLINHSEVKVTEFRDNMREFIRNAIKRGELKRMEPEIFWSIGYGPFYSLVKFHLQEKSLMGNVFTITDEKMKVAFDLVIKSLKP